MTTSHKNIGLILGLYTSPEVQLIAQEITRRGCFALVINSSELLKTYHLDYYPDTQDMCIEIKGQLISIEQIKGVYWSKVDSPNISIEKTNAQFRQLVTQANLDGACMLQLLFAQQSLNWVNSFTSIQFHRLKPQQLSRAKELGANIPASYIGNNPKRIKAFCSQHPKSIIKPVFSGGYTQFADFKDASEDAIRNWIAAPVTLQAFVCGKNIRTYVLNHFVVSAEIIEEDGNADKADFRQGLDTALKTFNIPKHIEALALNIAHAFHLKYTAIDWRLSPQGDFVFLEANPAPMFAKAQQQLNVAFDKAIVDMMFA